MKFMAFLATSLLSVASIAMPPSQIETMVLKNVKVDGVLTPYTGVLTIDQVRGDLIVQVYNDPCGSLFPAIPGQARCMAMPSLIAKLQAPLIDIENTCGTVHYKGYKDETPVDGPRTEISIADNRKRLCENVVESTIVADALVYNPWQNTTTHYHLTK